MINDILLITSSIFLTGAAFFGYKSKNSIQERLSSIILLIAGASYMLMYYLHGIDPETNLRTWRYLDWLFTVPILIYQMYLYLDNRGRTIKNLIWSIICMLGMLGFGFLGESAIISKVFGGLLGTMFSIYTFVALSNGISKNKVKFYLSVLGLWMFYPVVYFFTDSVLTIVLYSLVDLSAKLGVAAYIHTRDK